MAERKPVLPPLFTPQFLARLETLRLRTRRRFLGSRPGGHLSPRRGAGLEFADYRPYTPGDDPRYIDWKLYSRTDRTYIKLFQEEEELYTYLFLDYSASMAYPAGDGKEASVRDLALSLAYVVLASGDAVQLHVLSSENGRNATPFFRGRQRFFDLDLRFLVSYNHYTSWTQSAAIGEFRSRGDPNFGKRGSRSAIRTGRGAAR